MDGRPDAEAGVGLDGYPLGRSGDTEPASEAPSAANRPRFTQISCGDSVPDARPSFQRGGGGSIPTSPLALRVKDDAIMKRLEAERRASEEAA